jgi:predicted secreted protein
MSGGQLNTVKGRAFIFSIWSESLAAWLVVGGVVDRGVSFNNPTTETTSSSTDGDYAESEFVGFATATMNISGNIDRRNGVEPITGRQRIGTSEFIKLATTGNRCERVLMESVDPNLTLRIEGVFNISDFELTAPHTDKSGFTATLNNQSSLSVQTA